MGSVSAAYHFEQVLNFHPISFFQTTKMMNEEETRELKIVLVGDGAVGKTSLIYAFRDKVFLPSSTSTIYDHYKSSVILDGREVRLLLVDMAGHEDYSAFRPIAFEAADGFIACFALDSPESFGNIRELWLPYIRRVCPNAKVVIAGTKADTKDDAIDCDSCVKLAREIGAPYFSSSALNHENVDEIFHCVARLITNPEKPKKGRARRCSVL